MAKVLNSKDFASQLREMGQMDFDVSESRGYPVLQQTCRNQMKSELTSSLKDYFTAQFDNQTDHVANVYLTSEGVAIEIENNSVGTKVDGGNGMITLVVDIKFKNLDYDAMMESDLYSEEQQQKAEDKAAKEAAKKKKIASDTAKRAVKVDK